MKLSIIQQPENGVLGGPKDKSFSIGLNNASYDISINQLCHREIVVSTNNGSYKDILSAFYSLETLLMLFDGQFYPTIKAFDGAKITSSWNERRLPSYNSADFMLGSGNKLIEFDTILDVQLFQNWCALKKELDLVHNMVLYCLSSVEMPKDMQVAFMTEAFIGVCELINTKDSSFKLPKVPAKESKLKHYFLAVTDKYGQNIFAEEFSRDKEKFAQILVNSRNRIAHIKSKQGRTYLDGSESVMYLMKLSLLYRIILFDLLGIPTNMYNTSLSSRVQAINNHATTKSFLKSL